MRPFDTRAIENIAAAPATASDRRGAVAVAAALLALSALAVPFDRLRVGEVPAFLPVVVGAVVLAMTLTALLLYVQYRIERDPKLALLAIAYGFGAAAQALYLLTFPRLFAPGGILGAGMQTAAWWYGIAHVGFATAVIAQGAAARFRWRPSRYAVRGIAVGTVVLLLLIMGGVAEFPASLPRFVDEHGAFTPLWIATARLIAVFMLAGAVFVAGRLSTVAQVWLGVVLLSRALDVLTSSDLGGTRFSFGWYISRVDTLVGAVVFLGVFLVKINDLLLRLAARSRSTAAALAVGEARYASLANVVPQLIWTTDSRGDIEYVNDRWVAYTGLDLNRSRDGGWRSVVHPDDQAEYREIWMQSLRTGEPFASEFRLRDGRTGLYRWFLMNVVPARSEEGDILAWIGTCTDIHAQKRLEEREAFLARAGERLGASLDVSATVAAIKTLLIPRLAERTWVALLMDDGEYVLAGLGSTDIAEELDARRWIGSTVQPALHDVLARVVAGGDPVVPDRADRFPDPWAAELPASLTMIVPLLSGEVPIGVLTLVRTSARAYEPDDVALVREFARRAALSLEHARLYERERTTADALQRAMLPSQLPILPHIKFSASYSAASESQRVGGDFYDAFALPDGRVALTIGDVTGHGLEAAVIMGEIRQSLRAASFESAEPAAILDRASRLLVASGRSVFVTAIVGVFDPITGRLTYATAGHPPPLLDNGFELRRLPSAGLPIGLRDDEGVDFALRLHAPCTLVLFTDGLMEFARDLDEGERRIEDAIRMLARTNTDHLAGALMKQVLADEEATDDIAILTVSIDRFVAELPGDEREWRFVSDDGATGAKVRREVGELTAHWTGREDTRFASELAFGELIANVVRHARGPVRVIASTDGGDSGATLVVEDGGPGFEPDERGIEPFAESGRGLSLIRAVADAVQIDSSPHGRTRVVVTFAGRHADTASANAGAGAASSIAVR